MAAPTPARIPTPSEVVDLADAYDALAATCSGYAAAVARINRQVRQFGGEQFPPAAIETAEAIAAMARQASQTLRAGIGAAPPLQDA